MTEIAEAMMGIDMTTAETLTIIVKAMTNSGSGENGVKEVNWYEDTHKDI